MAYKSLDRKATLADVIRTVNLLGEQQESIQKHCELLEAQLNDLNATLIEMLTAAGAELEETRFDS